MAAYCLWDVREIHDQDAMDDYVARVIETVTEFDGEYLVVGGPWQVVEGDWRPSYPVLITFPSLERAHEWYSSDRYAPLRRLRLATSACDAVFLDGVDPSSSGSVEQRVLSAPLADVDFDLYREVHKGIRRGLFRITEAVGRVDPLDDGAVEQTTAEIERLLHLLETHSVHEDEHLGPLIDRHAPELGDRLRREHDELEARTADVIGQADSVRSAWPDERRVEVHRLYLTLSEFVAAYLQHQLTEEAEVMPALTKSVGMDELLAVNGALVAAITPEDMDAYMRLIAPAVNPIDLAELYGGMRAEAPADAFDSLLGIARDSLSAPAFRRLTNSLATA